VAHTSRCLSETAHIAKNAMCAPPAGFCSGDVLIVARHG
jgi:hypothetical protein